MEDVHVPDAGVGPVAMETEILTLDSRQNLWMPPVPRPLQDADVGQNVDDPVIVVIVVIVKETAVTKKIRIAVKQAS